ncbi:hypothetical protein L917_08848 [Phytophthora nicotianae]|uniref:Uncharacterized protein n=1 Tax=Phytophthora nicotianae TaxID=4792 RepID=W2L7Y0_PHYNI|nr:hypothetical protein L917_08848 [Phytophthora nicotianae]
MNPANPGFKPFFVNPDWARTPWMPQTTPASSFGPAWNAPFIGTPAGWQGATRSGGYPSHTYQPTTPTTPTLYSQSGWPGTPSTTLGEPYGPRGPNGPGRPNGPGGPGGPNPPGGSPLSSGVPFQGGDGSPGGGSQRSSPTHTQMVFGGEDKDFLGSIRTGHGRIERALEAKCVPGGLKMKSGEEWWTHSQINDFETLRTRLHNQFVCQTPLQMIERLKPTKRMSAEV